MKGCGQLIFRPSSRGLNFLSMTWKMAENPDIFVNYVIEEKEKPNPYAIGRRLIIGNEVYEDLDDVYNNHRPQLNELTKLMIQHKYFRYGTETDIQECLQEEASVSNRTCYALSYSYDRPGHFLLAYIVAGSRNGSSAPRRVQREYIGLTYAGYKFRGHVFETSDKLINWWKLNFRKNHPKNVKKTKWNNKEQENAAAVGNSNSAQGYNQSLNDDVMFNNHHENVAPYSHHAPVHPERRAGGYGAAGGGGRGGGYHATLKDTQHQPMPPQHGGHYGYNGPPPPHHHNGDGGEYNRDRNDNYRRRSRSRSREPRAGANGGGGYGYNHNYNNRY
mmetsp:Transcript_1301/g.2009  ORF Transcript_1301/g.2009 Transcript_1301/m.2009 type:complete len:332 (-) Transcript_1301:225-1220(-)